MHEIPPTDRPSPAPAGASAAPPAPARHGALALRSVIGGALMGFANIVPGISGGAMLILVGVYKRFITGVAEITTFTFRLPSLIVLGGVACAAGTTILLLAGPVKDIVLTYTWQTYALLIGMRLGVVPLIYGMAKPVTRSFWIGAGVGVLLTIGVAATRYASADFGAGSGGGPVMFFIAGLLGATATLLPGLDGSYVLMLLGQYVPILAGVDRMKDALGSGEIDAVWAAGLHLLPVVLGVGLGIGGVSLALRWLLAHRAQPTLGVLVGVLVGAVIGLWPFQRVVQPQGGQTLLGKLLTAEEAQAMPRDEWPMRLFAPSGGQVAAAIGLALLGFGLAVLIERLSPKKDDEPLVARPGT